MKKLIISIIGTIIIIITTIVLTFAWFISYSQVDPDVTGYSKAAYFASGDGLTEETAYEITSPRHLYNLAWLQYLGKFNTNTNGVLNKQYYFKITKDVDMTGYAIPPIGTSQYPFVGFLNGNNKVISNVNIYNDISNIRFHPTVVSTIENCNIMGLFGIIGNYNEMYSSYTTNNKINNVYINNISINSTCTSTIVGVFSGFIATGADIAQIGIHYSSLHMAAGSSPYTGFDSLSKYTLIGDYDDDTISWTDKPGGGMGFGGSLSFLSMFQRMKLISSNSWSTPSLNVPNNISSGFHPNTGHALPLLVSNAIDNSFYSTQTAEQTSSNNIGYYTGNGAKIYTKVTLDRVKTDDLTFASDQTTVTDVDIYTKQSNTAGEQYDIPVDISKSIKTDVINLLNYSDSNGRRFYGIRLNSQVSQNNPAKVSNMIVAGKQDSSISYLPSNAVWFVPQEDGVVKIVLAVADDGNQGFSIYSINRNASSDSNNPYNGTISSVNVISSLQDDDGNIVFQENYCREMTEGRIYYYELPVKKGTEYAIGQANSNGSYLIYLDVGQNGSSEVTTTSTISGIDFVYATSSTENGFSEISEEFASAVYFTIKGLGTQQLGYYFRRRSTDDKEVLYFISHTDSLVVITPNDASLVLMATDNTCTTATS